MSSKRHVIPQDTWRGRVARTLQTGAWMDAHDVSAALSAHPDIPYTLNPDDASSVLSDMALERNDDVVRREVVDAPVQFVYKLREDASVE